MVAEDKSSSLVGHELGPYKILGMLGAGGMGEVYLAQDTRMERRVALKLLPDLFTSDERRVRRFQQEARGLLALNHPNIVTIYEIGQQDKAHFIATELVEGTTLRERTKEGPLRLKEALDVTIQVLKALAAAHEAGIIHRDIKPENIMIRADGYVKVLDFGLAKLVEKGVTTGRVDTKAATVMHVSTDTGVVMGTVDYMSPEQARAGAVDERTDVWSLGVVLYEAVTGRRPFEGETKTDVIASLLEREPPPLARYLPTAPAELQRIVTKALTKDREERYQTVKDLLIDLKNLQRGLELEAELRRSAHSTGASSPTVIMSGLEESPSAETARDSTAQTSTALRAATTSKADYQSRAVKGRRLALVIGLVSLLALLLLVGVVCLAVFRFMSRSKPQVASSGAFGKVKVTRLTTTGQAGQAAISPDGKYVAHARGGRGQQSLWLRHIATGSDTQIIPTSQADYSQLAFSPDGNYIYFLRWETENVFYRVPVLGGPMQRLGSDIDAVGFSPDGRQVALMRGYPQTDEGILAIANADGTNEQRLVMHSQRDVYPPPASTWGPAWSPDGQVIVYALRKDVNGVKLWNLMAVRVQDHTEQQFTNQEWMSVGQIAWLADGSGLVITASDKDSYPAKQIWLVSYPNGEARRVTNDTNSYSGVSLTSDSTALATVQTERVANIWTGRASDTNGAAQVTSNNYDGYYGISWTPDGRLVYTTRWQGHSAIWIMNADGSQAKQLTLDGSTNARPSVSRDGRYIVFISNRTGNSCVWRMDTDGGNLLRLSSGASALRAEVTPDGRWVIYSDTIGGSPRLLKVSIDGGDPVQLTNYPSGQPAISPDGKQLAISFVDESVSPKRWRFGIINIEGGPPTKAFDLYNPYVQVVAWTPDGRALAYLDTRAGVTNLWTQPVDGSQAKPLTSFKSDQIFNYAWSRDGRQLALARGRETSDVVLINSLK